MKKRSITLAGHKTSIALEDEFWKALREIAAQNRLSLTEQIAQIDSTRKNANLTSSLRVFILLYFKTADTQTGHQNQIQPPIAPEDR